MSAVTREPAATVTSVLHHAGPVIHGAQVCVRCRCILRENAEWAWPQGVPIVASITGKGSQLAVFEGVTPGQFPLCAPA